MDDLDTLLSRSDPARGRLDDTDALIVRLSSAAAGAPRRRWWKTPRIVWPAAIGAAVLATGAAAFVPLTLGVNGTWVKALDTQFTIHYITDTGVTVDCQYGIYVGDPKHRTAEDERLAAFLNAEDWTGIGQEIYEKAMAEPFVPGPDDDWEVDTQETRDSFSFNMAMSSVINARIPDDLVHEYMEWGATSTCEGRLR